MSDGRAILHMMCGKIAAGKSTFAARLSEGPDRMLISEDDWLSRLYPNEIRTIEDYVRCSGRLRAAIGHHIEGLLRLGVTVILDFPANTISSRKWMRGLFENANAAHQLHFLDVPDDVCKTRLRLRNEAGTHDYSTNEAEFDLFTSHFVFPRDDEGFNVIRHAWRRDVLNEGPGSATPSP